MKLLQIIFILLAALWLYRVFRPYLNVIQKPPVPPPPEVKNQDMSNGAVNDEGEYIDYEEVK